MRFAFWFVICFLAVAIPIFGDTVTLKNGSKFEGVVIQNTASEVQIRTELGTLGFDMSKVSSVDISKTLAKPMARLATWDIAVKALNQGHWGGPIEQIPATVVDKGELRFVPYMSHRSGGYEMNIYGDPAAPACIEIGVYGSLVDDVAAKANCRTFIKSILGNAEDQKIIDKLKSDVDSIERDGFTFEVTPPTAEDSYGGWWISVYSIKALDASRATGQELAAITVSRSPAPDAKPVAQADGDTSNGWTASELAKARKPTTSAAPASARSPGPTSVSPESGGSVYVRGYTRKDGTYVSSYTRRAPSK